jgi:hypothetical protein
MNDRTPAAPAGFLGAKSPRPAPVKRSFRPGSAWLTQPLEHNPAKAQHRHKQAGGQHRAEAFSPALIESLGGAGNQNPDARPQL